MSALCCLWLLACYTMQALTLSQAVCVHVHIAMPMQSPELSILRCSCFCQEASWLQEAILHGVANLQVLQEPAAFAEHVAQLAQYSLDPDHVVKVLRQDIMYYMFNSNEGVAADDISRMPPPQERQEGKRRIGRGGQGSVFSSCMSLRGKSAMQFAVKVCSSYCSSNKCCLQCAPGREGRLTHFALWCGHAVGMVSGQLCQLYGWHVNVVASCLPSFMCNFVA